MDLIQKLQPLSASATNPTADSLSFNPYFTNQFGLGTPLMVGNPTTGDTIMQDTFPQILASDLSVPSDFSWVSLLVSRTSHQIIC